MEIKFSLNLYSFILAGIENISTENLKIICSLVGLAVLLRFVLKVLNWVSNLYKIYRESNSTDITTLSLDNINKDEIKNCMKKKKLLNKLKRLNNPTKKKRNKKIRKKDLNSTSNIIDFTKYAKKRWRGEER